MKRILAIAALLLCISFAAYAEFWMGGFNIVTTDLGCGAALSNRLLILDDARNELQIYDGEALQSAISAHTQLTENTARETVAVLSDGSSLYTIDVILSYENEFTYTPDLAHAELRRLNPDAQTGETVATLDLSAAANGQARDLQFQNAIFSGQTLYLSFELPPEGGLLDFNASDDCLLLRYELDNASPQRFSLGEGAALLSVQENLVLYAATDLESGEIQICLFDMASDRTSVLQTFSGENGIAPQFAFDLSSFTLYFNRSSQVFSMNASGEETLVATLPFSTVSGLALLSENRIAAWSDESVSVRPIDPDAAGNVVTLSVLGGERIALEPFSRANPEISVSSCDSSINLIDAFLTRSPEPDVLILRSGNDSALYDLLNRGYLLPLDSETVRSTAARMYPTLIDSLTVNGSLSALPIEQSALPMFGVNRALWDKMNLGDLPETWSDLFDLLNRWPDALKEHRFVALFEQEFTNDHARRMLFERMLADYESYRAEQSPAIGYDTEAFRALLDSFAAIDFQEVFKPQLASANEVLISAYYAPGASADSPEIQPLPLKIADDVPYCTATNLTVAAINPYSKHIDEAKKFVDYCAASLSPLARIELMPDENTPVRKENYESDCAYVEERMAEIQRKLDACENEIDRQPLEEDLKFYENLAAELESTWLANAESIARFREIAAHLSISYADPLDSTNAKAFADTINRYLSGELPADSLIGELERRYVMRAQEQN